MIPIPAIAPQNTWLSNLPIHWDRRRLKYLFRTVGGGTPSKDCADFWVGDIPWVSPKDMKSELIFDTEDHISLAAIGESATTLVPLDAILVVTRSGILQHTIPVAMTARAVTINQDIKAFIARKPNVVPSYYAALIRGFQAQLLTLWRKQGATVESLETDVIGDTIVPVPPVQEQRAIVFFLDREIAKIDTLIAKQTEFLTRLDEHRRALITEAVTCGLDPHVPVQDTGVTAFAKIPLHWVIKPLKALVRSDASITYGIVQAGPDVPDGIPYIRTSDMSGRSLSETGYLRTSSEIAASYARSRVKSGELVIAIRATVGKTLIVPRWLDGANLTQGTARIAPGVSISAEYLCHVLNSSSASQGFDAIAKGATFREITLEMLRNFRVPVPPFNEQAAIVRYLRQGMSRIEGTRNTATRMIACLRERRAAVITAAVTGQIDVTQPVMTEAAA